MAKIKLGLQETISLGTLEAKRDWGYAPEYVEAMWLMLQQQKPDDYVIATGENHSVRDFVETAFRCIDIELVWSGSGEEEKGTDRKTGKTLVTIDPRFFRPAEVFELRGDYSKAKKNLGWEPKTSFSELVNIMVNHDLEEVSRPSSP